MEEEEELNPSDYEDYERDVQIVPDENTLRLARDYNQYHISVGFPDSVIQKCQVSILKAYLVI